MNRLRLFLNRNYLFALLQGVVRKITTKERKKRKEKIILPRIILLKNPCIFSGATRVHFEPQNSQKGAEKSYYFLFCVVPRVPRLYSFLGRLRRCKEPARSAGSTFTNEAQKNHFAPNHFAKKKFVLIRVDLWLKKIASKRHKNSRAKAPRIRTAWRLGDLSVAGER
jgi:hypothetical protein